MIDWHTDVSYSCGPHNIQFKFYIIQIKGKQVAVLLLRHTAIIDVCNWTRK